MKADYDARYKAKEQLYMCPKGRFTTEKLTKTNVDV